MRANELDFARFAAISRQNAPTIPAEMFALPSADLVSLD
jgi:hypothetical protein